MGMLRKLFFRLAAEPRLSPLIVGVSGFLHRVGVFFLFASRRLLTTLHSDVHATPQVDFVLGLPGLHQKIANSLRNYRKDPESYKYFYGHPYQALGILSIFGDRMSDRRFDEYELRKFVRQNDSVLDIGCNCGFVSILTSYRIGCRVTGIDINPHMIEIGNHAAEHLNVSNLVSLNTGKIQNYIKENEYDVVFSFATHWTDDRNYRVSIDNHMNKMFSLLKPGGILLFESHCGELGRPEFHMALNEVKDRFEFDGMHKRTDGGSREFYVMRRRAGSMAE